jgi:hypothetical protein
LAAGAAAGAANAAGANMLKATANASSMLSRILRRDCDMLLSFFQREVIQNDTGLLAGMKTSLVLLPPYCFRQQKSRPFLIGGHAHEATTKFLHDRNRTNFRRYARMLEACTYLYMKTCGCIARIKLLTSIIDSQRNASWA